MINKQGLWFLTLFSLILVLSIYYITMPKDIYTINDVVNDESSFGTSLESDVTTSNYITTLKVELATEHEEEIKGLEIVINDVASTTDEKNNAYEKIKDINNIRGLEDQAVNKIKEEFNLDSCVRIDNDKISVVTLSETHDKILADKIMKVIQSLFTDDVIVSVKFV